MNWIKFPICGFFLVFSTTLFCQSQGQDLRGPLPPAAGESSAFADDSSLFDSTLDDYFRNVISPTPYQPRYINFEDQVAWESAAYVDLKKVLSGTRFQVTTGQIIQLLGVKMPRTLTHAARAMDQFKKETEKGLEKLLEGKPLKLEFLDSKPLLDGTYVALVYLPDGLMVNEERILEGRGLFNPSIPLTANLTKQFESAQKTAKIRKNGLWEEFQSVLNLHEKVPTTESSPTIIPEISIEELKLKLKLPQKMPHILVLDNGLRMEGEVTEEEKYVTLKRKDGNVISFPRSRVLRIEKK